jgi:hypothetical protein
MKVEVDAVREQVRVGERCWRFSLDCRHNTVTAALDGASFCLRPLRWGEKRNLARFARLGEAFLERELVKLCLDTDAELPQDEDRLAALAALARWINGPNHDGALPLDEMLLTKVAVSVATAHRLMPDRLDGLYAFEVELLWAGESGDDRAATAPDDEAMRLPPLGADTTRILVVPDAPPASRVSADAAREPLAGVAAATLRSRSLGDQSSDYPPPSLASFPAAAGEFRYGASLPASMATRLAAADRHDGAVAATASVDAPSPAQATAARQTATATRPQRRAGFARVAVTMNGAAPAPIPFGTFAATRARPAPAGAPAMPTIAAEPSSVHGMLSAARAPAAAPAHAVAALSRRPMDLSPAAPEASLEMAPAAANARSTDPLSANDLFLEWAERLEQAAEELGIEIGD